MAKQKKKRTKKYTGQDAAATRPTITRVTAIRRNKLQLWWLDHRRLLKPVLITSSVIISLILLIIEIIRIGSGA